MTREELNPARLQESSLTQPRKVDTAVESCCIPLVLLGTITQQPPDEYPVKVEEGQRKVDALVGIISYHEPYVQVCSYTP